MDCISLERPTKRLLTVKEAAQYLNCSTDTVRRLQYKGALPIVRYNRLVYFDKETLDAFIEKHTFIETQ
jgi:excisionase family DNA binding protein